MVKALMLCSLLLAGCASFPTESDPTVATGDWCDTNEPRRHSPEVIGLMTEDELDELNAHNRYGTEHCGWRP